MRKILIILTVMALFFACNEKKETSNGFEIDASISGFDAGSVNLKKIVDGEWKTVDSVECKEGKFTLKGTVDFPEMYYLTIGDDRHLTSIFLDNSKIQLVAHYDSLMNANITGSKSQDELKHYENEMTHFNDKMKDLSKQYKEADKNEDQEAMNQISATYDTLYKERNKFVENYIVANNKSAVSPYILSKIYYSMEANKLDSILKLFDPSLDKSAYIKTLKDKLAIWRNVEEGKQAPDFTLNDTTGNAISLSSFKGKYLLIDFWASWCGPCRAENPNNVEIYKEFKDKGVEFIGVSLDAKRDAWVKAIKEDGLTWPQVSDLKGWKSEAGKLYGVSAIPHTVLLDKEGIIIAKNLRGKMLKDKIIEVLKK